MSILIVSLILGTQTLLLIYLSFYISEKNDLIDELRQIIGMHEGANATLIKARTKENNYHDKS